MAKNRIAKVAIVLLLIVALLLVGYFVLLPHYLNMKGIFIRAEVIEIQSESVIVKPLLSEKQKWYLGRIRTVEIDEELLAKEFGRENGIPRKKEVEEWIASGKPITELLELGDIIVIDKGKLDGVENAKLYHAVRIGYYTDFALGDPLDTKSLPKDLTE